MANETYGIGIRVETSSAEKSLQVLQNQFARLQRIIATSTTASGKDLDRLTKMLNQTEASMKRLQAASNTAGTAIAKSGKDFTNISRVIQDLPFGFQGIQNNLTQLVPAAGAAGLAFSALVSAITFAGTGLSYWIKGSGKAKEATKEFSDELNSAKASAISTGLKLQAFVNIAKDGNLPLSQRNEALKQANEILGEHGEKLTLANIATKDITKQVENFTQALIQQAVASKYSDKAADLIIQQAELSKKIGESATAANKAFTKLNQARGATNQMAAGFVGAGAATGRSDLQALGKEASKQLSLYKKDVEAYKQTTSQLKGVSADMQIATNKSAELFGVLGTKVDETTKKVEKFNTAAYKTKMSGMFALDLEQTPQAPDQPKAKTTQENPYTLAQLQAYIEGKKNDALFAQLNQKRLEDERITLAASGKLYMARAAMVAAASDMLKKKMEEEQQQAAALKMQLANLAIEGFENLINVATSANASFDSIKKALGDMIKQLAIAAVKALAFRAIMAGLSGGATVVGGAVGGGFLGKIFGFATGGIVTGPTPAMIGEGTEAEAVMPLSQLQSVIDMNSGGNGYIADTRISGADLLLMIRRATQSGAFSGTSF